MSYYPNSEQEFYNIVNQPRVVIIKFYMDGCGPCVNLQNDMDMLIKNPYYSQRLFANGILIVNINEAQFPNLANMYGVRSFPSVFVKTSRGTIKLNDGVSAQQILDYALNVTA